jgi:hypothetical protein
MTTVLVEIASKGVAYRILLDQIRDDHIVVCIRTDARGFEVDVTLGHDTWAWDRAVRRARHAEAFL